MFGVRAPSRWWKRWTRADALDPRFPIQSSGELAYLSLLVEWAQACRLVRVARGRIVAVRKHAALLARRLKSRVRSVASVDQPAESGSDSDTKPAATCS